jgi:hypothetical protein
VESRKLKVESIDTNKVFYNPEKPEEFTEIQALKENKFLRYKITQD